jgi:putative ABC transport system permease protein
VLGDTTMRRIGAHVGDTVPVTFGPASARMRVVGAATFPRFAAYPGADKTGLGDGAAMSIEGLRRFLPSSPPDFFLVRGSGAALAALGESYPPGFDEDAAASVLIEPQRPDDLSGYDRVNSTPLLLAGMLGLLAAAATANGVVQATRRRRHDLAVLRVIGFTASQVRRTVRWQALTVAAVALLVGIPLGVALGRTAWSTLADRLGTPAAPVVPWLAVVLTVPAVVVLLGAVAAVPARRTGAVSAATILRAE